MMAGENIEVDVSGFNNNLKSFKTKEDVFTYLIHLGYLAYNGENKTCRIPNTEIKSEWGWIIGLSKKYKKVGEITNLSKKLLEATYNLEGEEVAKSLEKSHELLTSNLSYNNEQSMQSAIMLSYFYAYDYYTILPEVTTGKGYADIVMLPFVPNIPALVIDKPSPIITPPKILEVAIGKVYLVELTHLVVANFCELSSLGNSQPSSNLGKLSDFLNTTFTKSGLSKFGDIKIWFFVTAQSE